MALKIRALAVAGALAGTTMFAAPASAAALPATGLGAPSAVFDSSRYDPAAANAEWGCRWNCGWGHRRGWRRNRVSAGDVLIGAAIIGGIAAIASSNNRRQRDRDVVIVERDVRDREWRDDDRRYDDRRIDDRRTAPRSGGASGLDNAVDQCLARIERDVRVDTVDNVDRTGAGWIVSGSLFNGSPFQCRIGNSGQIDGIDYGNGFSGIGYSDDVTGPAPRGEGQWDDQGYAAARMAIGGAVRPDLAVQEAQISPAPLQVAQGQPRPVVTDRMPAYPGGPIPGEDIPETIDGDL